MKTIFSFIIFLISITSLFGQSPITYNLELVNVIDYESTEQTSIVLRVTPKVEEFKLVISGKAEYALGKKRINSNIQLDSRINIVIYGADMKKKDPELYSLIKLDSPINKDEFILVFNINNIPKKKLNKGFFKYGLWEGKDQNTRIEKTFEFSDDIIIIN